MEDSHGKPMVLEDFSRSSGSGLLGNLPNSNHPHSLPLKKPMSDLAPIHLCNVKSSNYSIKNCDKICRSKESGSRMQLAKEIQEKLTIKTKNCNINGMKHGTTDVEVHCGAPLKQNENDNCSSSVAFKHGGCVKSKPSHNITQVLNSSQESTVNSDSNQCSSSVSAPINNCSKEGVNSGAMCNGHSVSEATSTNSIAVSDLSISSEKSVDSYSYSGARPRIRNESNSSSQSTQPRSDVDLSFNSDTSKVLDRLSEAYVQDSSHSLGSEEVLNMEYVNYENENQMGAIMSLIQKDLSEPYSIYTYRYFIHNWPKLCFLAIHNGGVVGAIVCKLDMHKKAVVRGYIAMLAVDERYRKKKIGSNLVQRAIRAMAVDDADEVVLETEITNKPALQLYENLGFVRDKRLFRYYLNGVDALRLKLWLR